MADSEADVAAVRDLVSLVAAAQAGDNDALTELISAHLPLVYSIIGRALRGHADVDDVVQETMVRVMRGLPGLREPDRFRAWVVAIAYRQVQLHLRERRKHLQRREAIAADHPDTDADFAEQTVTELVLQAQRRELTEAARWLDVADRWLMALWWRETVGELTRAQVAAELAVSQKHAGSRLRRMKAQLGAVRAVVRALQSSPGCGDLTAVAHGWNGVPTPVWRKRLVRHVRDCPRCSRHGHGLVPPERLLLGVASLPIVAGLAVEAPASGALTSAWAAVQNFFSTKMVAAAAVVTVAAGGGFTYAVYEVPTDRDGSGAIARPAVAASATAPVVGGPGAAASATPTPSVSRAPSVAGTTGVTTADVYVAPGGSDTGSGTVERPFATLAKAVSVVRPGQTIALRGGTYRPTEPVAITTSGGATSRITLSNYRNERPVIDASLVPADKWMITHKASYWTVQGLEIKNSRRHAYVCVSCRYNILQRLSIHDNARSALTLRNAGTIGNQILDSDFFNNYDPDEGGNAGIGLGIGDGSGEGNLIRGNRAFNNADNGFDLGDFASPVTVEHNWAYGNGVNRWNVADWQSNGAGFRLGGGNPVPAAAHVLRHNAAWDNIDHGFGSSGNRGAMELTNNTAFRNGADGFHLPDVVAATVNDNAADGNDDAAAIVGADTALRGNSWQSGTVSFRSTDPSIAQGPRAAGGALPRSDFLATSGDVGAAMSG